jgi:Na+-translocating ferredoxin:NAD+ oxidoreductase RnfG subunit
MQRAAASLIFTLAVCAAGALSGQTEVLLSLKDAPRVVFPTADSVVRKDVKSTRELRSAMQAIIGKDEPSIWEPFYISYVARKNDKVEGYAVICEEVGKHRPITFIVAADRDGKVRDVAIMMYRESRGGEVRYPGFTKQFLGKGLADPIKHRRDIRNVTGATMSSRALARGVRKALAFLKLTYLEVAGR